ncbi:MAG: NAD(P)-binding protein [Pirellulaceae bacterium]|nr:NAD(P)-binding protein [Pirellulaceae bacterium]
MNVLIVGGGIGGLATALGLHRIGCDVQVLEKAPSFTDMGAALSLWSNGIYALNQLAVADRVLQHGSDALRFCDVRNRDGRLIRQVDWDRPRRLTGFPTVAVHRARLIDALADPIRDRIHHASECCRIDLARDHVDVECQDGRAFNGDLLIAADGIHSAIRQLMFPDVHPSYQGYVAFRALVDRSQIAETTNKWQLTLANGGQFGCVPINNQQAYWFGTKNVSESEAVCSMTPDAIHAEAAEHFASWHDRVGRIVAATSPAQVLRTPIYDLPTLDWWCRGRMTLTGDAAHAMTPNLGQGACQAIEDAVVLTRMVQRCRGDRREIPAALKAFERERRTYVGRIQRTARVAGQLMQNQNPIARVACQNVVRFLGGSRFDAAVRCASKRTDLSDMVKPSGVRPPKFATNPRGASADAFKTRQVDPQ